MLQVSFRVRYQVESWKERDNLNPKDWGWKENGKPVPLYTSKDAAPASLVKLIICGCKGGCTKRTCTYRRYNLKCSNMCGECKGVSCLNCYKMNESENE